MSTFKKKIGVQRLGIIAALIGFPALAVAQSDATLGAGATAPNGSIAIGDFAQAASNAVVIGNGALASGATNSVAIGNSVLDSGTGNVAIGNSVIDSGTNNVAIGNGAMAGGTNSVAIGAGSSDGGLANVVSVGNGSTQRRIINVAPGIGYYDAVNMSQLRDVTLALGSGNFDSVTGVWTNPTFTVPTVTGSTTYSNVSAALTGLGVRVTALENKSASTGTGVPGPAGPTGPQGPQGPQGVAGTDGGGMTAAQVTSLAQTQANTALTQANSYTDQQIGSLSSQINGLGQQIAGLGQQINNVDRDAREGIASTAALTRTAAAPYAPGHTVVMTGGAVYRGQAAGAIGVSRWSDNGLNNVNVGFAYGGGNSQVFSAGFAHIF